MKRPRDILLERHRDRQPALDRLRREVVCDLARDRAGGEPASHRESESSRGLRTLLVQYNRWVWTGLAVVWVVIAALQATMPSLGSETLSQRSGVTSHEMREQLRKHETLLLELRNEAEARVVEQTEGSPSHQGAGRPDRSRQTGVVQYAHGKREVEQNSTHEERGYVQV